MSGDSSQRSVNRTNGIPFVGMFVRLPLWIAAATTDAGDG
jgi:hypothetical protein